jgi:hypothetical protein
MIRRIIRKLLPVSFRIVIESIIIDIFRFFGKKHTKLTMKEFPIRMDGGNALKQYPFLQSKNVQYFAQIYGCEYVTDVTVGKRSYINYTSEIVPGKLCSKSSEINITHPSVLPVSIINKATDIARGLLDVQVNDDKILHLKNLQQNRFHYLPVPKNSKIKLSSKSDYIVGNPIITSQEHSDTKKKLVVSIFIDGLASEVFKSSELKELMPNTFEYFQSGILFFNGFSNSNWTLPSVTSMVSSLYPINHKFYHPSDDIHLGDNYSVMSEFFRDAGYLTAQICSNFRKNPGYNYSLGFDRSLYRNSMGCDEVITKGMEHLRAFKNRSNFLWLTFFETHHFLHGVPDISNQVNTKLDSHSYSASSVKSPYSSFDEKRSKSYIEEVKRIDFYLGIFFDYIKKNYCDNEVVISICSDHGKGFLGDEKNALAPHRVSVPMFFQSSDTNYKISNKIVENVDFLPSLLDLSGIKYNKDRFDGVSVFAKDVHKEYAISEVIYPNDFYCASVYDNNYIFYLKSNCKIFSIEDIDFYDCAYSIILRSDSSVIERGNTNQLTDKSKKYFKYFVQHKRDPL